MEMNPSAANAACPYKTVAIDEKLPMRGMCVRNMLPSNGRLQSTRGPAGQGAARHLLLHGAPEARLAAQPNSLPLGAQWHAISRCNTPITPLFGTVRL